MIKFFVKYQEKEMKVISSLIGVGLIAQLVIWIINGHKAVDSEGSFTSNVVPSKPALSMSEVISIFGMLGFTLFWTYCVFVVSKNFSYKLFWLIASAVFVVETVFERFINSFDYVVQFRVFAFLVLCMGAVFYFWKKKRA